MSSVKEISSEGREDNVEETSEEEQSESEEPEEEIEDEEPKLKYQRLGASVTDILSKDSASCLAAHEKFLVCPLS